MSVRKTVISFIFLNFGLDTFFCVVRMLFLSPFNRRFQSYGPLKEDVVSAGPQLSQTQNGSGTAMFWNLVNRRGAVDSCPLLQDRLV